MPDQDLTDGPGVTREEIYSYASEVQSPPYFQGSQKGIENLLERLEEQGVIEGHRVDPAGGIFRLGSVTGGQFYNIPASGGYEDYEERVHEIIADSVAVDASGTVDESGESFTDVIPDDTEEVVMSEETAEEFQSTTGSDSVDVTTTGETMPSVESLSSRQLVVGAALAVAAGAAALLGGN